MKKALLIVAVSAIACSSLQAQDAPAKKWAVKGDFGVQFTNSIFSTYQSTGNNNNATSLTGGFNYAANYKNGKHNWGNDLKLQYGVARQTAVIPDASNPGVGENKSAQFFAKNRDLISFSSIYGYELKKHLNFAALGNFQSQFTRSFKDPSVVLLGKERQMISSFLAPAVMNAGLGLEYKPNDNFSVYYSPVMSKLTVVRLDSLRDDFNVLSDNGLRYEFGSFLNMTLRKELMKGITYSTKLQLFTNYIKNKQNPGVGRPGSIDIQLWSNSLIFQVNKYIAASFTANVIYDEDILFGIKDGDRKTGIEQGYKAPRTQYNQVLGIGLTYNFSNEKK